ncbi:hypothetical protein SH661x_003448 [Planctomicrobium sp. SH661]|uniref:hypothetical protein n=1 Tax=Planctomicrobium sp. SH661 TaxID=3448124 RepID=UPI003F5C8780
MSGKVRPSISGRFLAWTVLATIVSAGCSYDDGVPPLHRVKSTVTLDGKPVAGATVIFQPITSSKDDFARVCLCLSDKNGEIKPWTMVEGDGLAVGKYRVGVYAAEQIGGPKLDENSTAADEKKVRLKYIVPKRYMDANTSGIEVEVTKRGRLQPESIVLVSP